MYETVTFKLRGPWLATVRRYAAPRCVVKHNCQRAHRVCVRCSGYVHAVNVEGTCFFCEAGLR